MDVQLNLQETPPQINDDASDVAERRLWFDYLKSINDQRLQSNRSSGLTTYALLGVLAGILYTFVPRLPNLLAIPGTLRSSLITTTLLADISFALSAAYVNILHYCGGDASARTIPAAKGRALSLLLVLGVICTATLCMLHWRIGVDAHVPNRLAKWLIRILGCIWLIPTLLFSGIGIFARRTRSTKLAPLFPYSLGYVSVPSKFGWIGCIQGLTLAGLALWALILYLRSSHIFWIVPVGTGAVSLTGLYIVALLLLRGLRQATQLTYESLQQDILLDRLSPSEIRGRFLRDALGHDLAEWLDQLLTAVQAEDDKLKLVCIDAQKRLQEIMGISPMYPVERNSRATKLRDEIEAAVAEYNTRVQGLWAEVKVLRSARKPAQDQQVVQRWLQEVHSLAQKAENLPRRAEHILTDLKPFIGEQAHKASQS